MIKIEIKKQGEVTHGAVFSTQSEVDQWLSDCEATKAFGEDYEIVVIPDYQDQDQINAEALAYLQATDYMVLKSMEGDYVVPEEIKVARQAARDRIVR